MNNLPPEAAVTVNGESLTSGDVMTIRVALNSFICELAERGLGDDYHGKRMVELYTESAIRTLLKLSKP
jgi:hypothetical protein